MVRKGLKDGATQQFVIQKFVWADHTQFCLLKYVHIDPSWISVTVKLKLMLFTKSDGLFDFFSVVSQCQNFFELT